MSASLHFPPLLYTLLAIAIANREFTAAAVILLNVAADNQTVKEHLPRVAPVTQATARRAARQH